jgi:hypothetical protein
MTDGCRPAAEQGALMFSDLPRVAWPRELARDCMYDTNTGIGAGLSRAR